MPDSRPSDAAVRPTLSRLTLLAALLVGLLAPSVWGQSNTRLTPIVRAVRDAMPAVVNIQGQKSIVEEESAHPVTKQVNGMGTGVLIDSRGFILTNYHVVDGVKRINVTLSTGQSYIAKIVARDPKTDLAIIRINPSVDLPVISLGSSQGLMAGETVIAVGNAYGYENTVTTGIISALHRNVQVNETQQYLDLIQTDASINPGNSGGPLLNIDGEMIGLNVAVRAGAQGIGFAIPVDNALEVATQLMSIERLENNWHGMATMSLPSADGAVTIARIDRNSPAESCGLARGDMVEQIGGLPIRRPIDIERALLGHRSGESVSVLVRRDSEEKTLQLTLATRGSQSKPTNNLQDSLDSDSWDTLGLILEEVPVSYFRDHDLSYNGGMRITAVRPESSAAQQGVQEGDILIRFHRWTTATKADIKALVNRADTLAQEGPYRFYIVRGENTHWAEMKVAARTNTSVR